MKIYAQQFDIPEEMKNLIRVHRITIDVILENISKIQSTTEISPLKRADGTWDQYALDLFDEFVINALEIFGEHNYEVIHEHQSPHSDSQSWYFTLVKRDQLEKMEYKYILFIRISDHENKKATEAGRRKYYNDAANSIKQPPTKARQTWRLKEITVNRESFFSYEDALEEIDRRLD